VFNATNAQQDRTYSEPRKKWATHTSEQLAKTEGEGKNLKPVNFRGLPDEF
jgi:hypothetical protein